MVLESNQRHHEGPVLFALTQLAYSRQVLVSDSLNQLLHSIPQARLSGRRLASVSFHFSNHLLSGLDWLPAR